jgi:flagellar hook-associated protein 3 FlgL
MGFRVTDSATSAKISSLVASSREKISELQLQLQTGKRINRPSDDPASVDIVLNLKTSLDTVNQFKRNATAAKDFLGSTDNALNTFETLLDRTQTLLSQGLTDVTGQTAKDALAVEIEVIRERVLNLANTKFDDRYLFGGTRQDDPPYDPTTMAAAAVVATEPKIRVEPDANPIATGVVAEDLFADGTGTIFTVFTSIATALRGTGNAATDKASLETALDRIIEFSGYEKEARSKVGARLNAIESAQERLGSDALVYEASKQQTEGIDFANTVLKLSESERAFEAILQSSRHGRQSLIDFLG